jgi:hypothetical protein
MVTVLAHHLADTARFLVARLRERPRTKGDAGGTLEYVLLVLGGVAFAGLVVAAIYASVKSNIAKLP